MWSYRSRIWVRLDWEGAVSPVRLHARLASFLYSTLQRWHETRINPFRPYLQWVCMCPRSDSGECVRCASAADDRHGCVCLQASLPTLTSSPARKRPKRAEHKRVTAHLNSGVQPGRKGARLLRISALHLSSMLCCFSVPMTRVFINLKCTKRRWLWNTALSTTLGTWAQTQDQDTII